MKRIICAALAFPLVALGQPVAFDFDSGETTASCILDSGRTAKPKDSAHPDHNEARGSGVFIMENSERGGVFIKSPQPDDDVLGKAISQLTVCMAFCASPLSQAPTFLERLVGSTASNKGFFRFRSQSHSKDDNEKLGTMRFEVRDEQGNPYSAASTIPWIQQNNTWYWVGLVFDKGRITFYLNGEQLGDEIQLPLEEIPGSEGLSYFWRGGYGFIGAFDDLLIIPGNALTDAEMQAIYEKGIGNEKIIKKLKE